MKVKYIKDEEFIQETWYHENKKGQVITIHKGDIFHTGAWGTGGYESVLTDKDEWICDVDCKEFNELFEVIKEDDLEKERLLKLLEYSQEAIDYWFNMTDSEQSLLDENDHFKEEVKYFIEKLSK